ncbi:MAG: LacI family DNA-binding transcriptional regulator [Verrucomicrobiota bacterium JB024]|nr:LacI family DNA-binding transcriptional regulator [Verrucomicrobiota bacterium JB024]
MSALASYRNHLRAQPGFNVIALVSDWSPTGDWLNSTPSARELVRGATQRARTLGYSLQHFNTWENEMTPPRLSQILHARGIRGLIIAPFAAPSALVDLDWNGFSIVTIERPLHYGSFHHIVPNYYADMTLVHHHLRAKGYQSPGLILEHKRSERAAHQWEAAHDLVQKSAPTPVPSLTLASLTSSRQILDWYDRHRPDVVVGVNNAILRAFKSAGIKIPQQVGYASLNAMDDALDEFPRVSGILQPRASMGAAAIDILNTQLQLNHRGPGSVSLGTHADGTWSEGETLRATNT